MPDGHVAPVVPPQAMLQLPVEATDCRPREASQVFTYVLPSQPHTVEAMDGQSSGMGLQNPMERDETQTPTAIEQNSPSAHSSLDAQVPWQPVHDIAKTAGSARTPMTPNHGARFHMAPVYHKTSTLTPGDDRSQAMPLPRRLAVLGCAAAIAAGCSDARRAPDGGAAASGGASAVASSQAPPLDTAPAPAPPPPGATAPAAAVDHPPDPPLIACPREMIRVPGGLPPRDANPAEPAPVKPFCIDRWEASLIDRRTGQPLSPYYPPDRRTAVHLAETWEKQRLEIGSDEARQVPIPELAAWRRQREIDPVAVSKAGVVPNGYLSGNVAALACKNAGKRLCRHDEWVLACEGEQRRRYPYGDAYKQGACNIFRAAHPALVLHDNPSIGHLDPRLNLVKEKSGDPLLRRTGATLACRSTWGDDALWDMNGNLDEWVEDEHGRFNGGFFSRSKRDGCASTVTAHKRDYYDYSTGTRCCLSPDSEAPRR